MKSNSSTLVSVKSGGVKILHLICRRDYSINNHYGWLKLTFPYHPSTTTDLSAVLSFRVSLVAFECLTNRGMFRTALLWNASTDIYYNNNNKYDWFLFWVGLELLKLSLSFRCSLRSQRRVQSTQLNLIRDWFGFFHALLCTILSLPKTQGTRHNERSKRKVVLLAISKY